ncbi:MAG: hypothetical protein ACYTF3_08235 [Planctomycetota bacterium]
MRSPIVIAALAAGGTVTLDVAGATPLSTVLVGYSLTGAGPTATQYGFVAMSPPIQLLTGLTTDLSGSALWSSPVPPSAGGLTLYTQAVDLASGTLSNPLAEPVL